MPRRLPGYTNERSISWYLPHPQLLFRRSTKSVTIRHGSHACGRRTNTGRSSTKDRATRLCHPNNFDAHALLCFVPLAGRRSKPAIRERHMFSDKVGSSMKSTTKHDYTIGSKLHSRFCAFLFVHASSSSNCLSCVILNAKFPTIIDVFSLVNWCLQLPSHCFLFS